MAYTKGITKEEFVRETKLQAGLDHFLKGTYSRGIKGCAVGCAIKSISKLKHITLTTDDHKNLEVYLGIPEWLARLEDTLFEGVSLEYSKQWPVEFAEAINTGADLNTIEVPFRIFILETNISNMEILLKTTVENKDILLTAIKAHKQAITALKSNDSKLLKKAREASISAARAAEAAEIADWAARKPVRSAAWSAAWSAAQSAVYSTAEAATQSAEGAKAAEVAKSTEAAAWAVWKTVKATARSAAGAFAWSAARAAVRAATYSTAWSATYSTWPVTYKKFADKLLELLKECK